MTVDTSRLKRRKGLGAPPTEGTPGLESEPMELSRAVDGTSVPPSPLREAAPLTTASGGASDKATTPFGTEAGALRQSRVEPATLDEAMPATSKPAVRRVPPREEESRISFTTRVTVSTKERLENACYHLRRRHQEFVNEAIAAHLEKHGF